MILIVGGAAQGKKAYAKKLAKTFGDGALGKTKQSGGWAVAYGETDPPEWAFSARVILDFHGFLRRLPESDLEAEQFVDQVLKQNPLIITMNEVGCGIVPLDRWERDYRELVGRSGQRLAAAADQVYRMSCGIPTCIKGAGQ